MFVTLQAESWAHDEHTHNHSNNIYLKFIHLGAMKKLKFILFWISQILSFPLLAQTVSNVQAEQVGKQIVITYSLDKQADISVCYTTDGGKTFSDPLKQVTGDVGKNITAGHHTITWNVLEEVDKLIADDIMFVVIPSGGSLTFIVKGVTFKMVKVAGGTFTMGVTAEQGKDAYDCERPAHQVTLTDYYYIGQTEVSQALWKAVMGRNPSKSKGDNLPVEQVSWEDCQTFIKKLNRLLSKQLGGKRFALPTEAQWEFAARGGNKSKGYTYSGSNNLDDVAWYWDNSGKQTHPVAQKQPNELGLYDMSGNVREWCQDWYVRYSGNAQTNPQGPASAPNCVDRGGCWYGNARNCRVSYRSYSAPGNRGFSLGFRLCLIP